jgi:hypothetical protein
MLHVRLVHPVDSTCIGRWQEVGVNNMLNRPFKSI